MLKLFARAPTDPQAKLKEIFDGYVLPTFPNIYLDALHEVRDRGSSTEKLADILACDPGLTVRLMATVNSAAFGLRRQVKSVHHAVSMLGRGHIESMLVSLASHATLPSAPCDGFDPQRFWRTAARRAATARALADRLNPVDRSECFTAALLSDMAVPMLCMRKGRDYARIIEHWHQGDGDLQVMEYETFGWDHAEVGALMCAEWDFPEVIGDAIASHHGSDDLAGRRLQPVNLVGFMREVDEERGIEEFAERAQATMGLDPDDLHELVQTCFLGAEEIAEQFA